MIAVARCFCETIVKSILRYDRSCLRYVIPLFVFASGRRESLAQTMWRLVFALTLVSVTLVTALPAAQQDDGSLSSLISAALPNVDVNTTPQTVPAIDGDKLDRFIEGFVRNISMSTTTAKNIILGTDNQTPSKPDDCECVPYYLCKEGKIVENGIGIIDIRSDFGDKDKDKDKDQKPPG